MASGGGNRSKYINPADGSPLVNETVIEGPSAPDEKDQEESDKGKRKRVKRTIPAGVDIIELFIYTDDAIYAR
ncbi:hypothetical protein CHS0354_037718 [Potamilus streckersoni]|uniref:Uncharacterized protein n=1 Tax=Potamilus streckersoni TaxID=2493646 RepID=A0AAE0W5P7_9BIVA|nr:hypothetical protein CHS0354_037718 [Potamilus streckersoni]